MRKHRLSASIAGSAVAAGTAIGTAIATGQPATAAPAQPPQPPQPRSNSQVVHDFMVANQLLKFEHAAYWHVVDGKMVFAKDPVATAAPVHQHTFSAPAPTHQAVALSSRQWDGRPGTARFHLASKAGASAPSDLPTFDNRWNRTTPNAGADAHDAVELSVYRRKGGWPCSKARSRDRGVGLTAAGSSS